jgi:hypothetical protein
MNNKNVEEVLNKFGEFYEGWCKLSEKELKEELESVSKKFEEDGEGEDKMNELYVMMEVMGMME